MCGYDIDRMGKHKCTFDEALQEVSQEIAWLKLRWHTYLALFGRDEGRINVLNERSGFIFGIYQQVLWDAVLLAIAKLLGHHKSAGKAVICLEQGIVALTGDAGKAELSRKFNDLRQKHKRIIAHRDQRIAHTDVEVALNPEALDGISREQVREAVRDIDAFLNEIGLLGKGQQFGFLDFDTPEFNAKVLCRLVALGNAEIDGEEAAKRERYKRDFGIDEPVDDPLNEDNL
jgi:hypothetical protein